MTRRKKPFPFFLWHRRLGLAALVLVFILSITGIMLNHTESLKLDEAPVESDLILNWYGINPRGEAINFSVDHFWISQWDQQLFFNGKSFFTHKEIIKGIVRHQDIIAIALETSVLLIDMYGEIIELIPVKTHAAISHIGFINNKIALLDSLSNFYLSDTQLTHWQQQNHLATQWASPTALTDAQRSALKQAYRGLSLNLERVVLDLHSGRIFNDRWGVYIMDASALLMMLLGISGLWIWWLRKLKMSKKKHFQKHH